MCFAGRNAGDGPSTGGCIVSARPDTVMFSMLRRLGIYVSEVWGLYLIYLSFTRYGGDRDITEYIYVYQRIDRTSLYSLLSVIILRTED